MTVNVSAGGPLPGDLRRLISIRLWVNAASLENNFTTLTIETDTYAGFTTPDPHSILPLVLLYLTAVPTRS